MTTTFFPPVFDIPTVPPVGSLLNVTEAYNYELDFAGGIALGVFISIGFMLAGFIFLFFGSRLFKTTLFFFAFFIAGALGFYVFSQWFPTDAQSCFIAAAVVALIAGLLTLKLFKWAIFMLGAGVGFVLWFVVKALIPDVFSTPSVYYISLIGCVIVFGLISLAMQKTWLLIGSPPMGSFVFIQGIHYFIPNENTNIMQLLDYGSSGCLSTACYILYSSIICLAMLGWFVQWRYTSERGRERMRKNAALEEGKDKGRRDEMQRRRKDRKKYRRRSSVDD